MTTGVGNSQIQFPIAHAGHWIVDVLTLLPAALIALWFVGLAIRQRLRRDRD